MTVGSARDQAGRFTGEGGGRIPGIPNAPRADKRALANATLEAVQATSSEAIRQLRAKVQQGEWAAIRLVLEYCLPKGGRTVELDSSDPNALLDAIADGTVSPDEAARLAQALKTTMEASDVAELNRKVEELELLITSLAK